MAASAAIIVAVCIVFTRESVTDWRTISIVRWRGLCFYSFKTGLLIAAAGSAAEGLSGFFGIHGDAEDARAKPSEFGDLAGAEILSQYVIGDRDGLFLLKGNGLETCGLDKAKIFVFLDGAGDATGIHFSGFLDLGGQGAFEDDVGNAEMASGFKDAVDFPEDAVFIGDEVEDAVGYDYVGDIRGNGHFFYVALTEFDVVVTELVSIGAGLIEHGGREVDTDDLTPFPGFGAGNKTIITGSGSQVDHYVAFFDLGELSGKATAQAQVSIGIITAQGTVIVCHNSMDLGGAASGTATR